MRRRPDRTPPRWTEVVAVSDDKDTEDAKFMHAQSLYNDYRARMKAGVKRKE